MRIIALLAVTAVLPLQANAQIQNQPTEVITATPLSSFSERAGLWPSTEISRDTLNLDAAPLRDRLNTIPGIQSRENGSPTISIRGSAQADRVLEMYDGIPLNMADGLGPSVLFVPEEVIGSTEILKGPASVFYGSSAMAGSLDHRLRLFDRPAAKLSVADDGGWLGPRSALLVAPFSTGSNDRAQASVFYQDKPGRTPYVSTSTTKSGRLENDAEEVSRATGAWQAQSGPWDFSSRLLAVHEVGEGSGSLQSPYLSTSDISGSLVSLGAGRSFSDKTLKHASVRIADTRMWGLYDRGKTSESTSFTGRTQTSADVSSSFADGQVQSRTFVDNSVDDLKATYLGNAHFIENRFEPGEILDFNLNPSLTLSPGTRYLPDSGVFVSSVGAVYSMGADRTWITWSQGFRRPSLSDRYTDLSYFKGNSSLKPERSESIELGFEAERGQRFGNYLDGFAYGFAVFQTEYDDIFDTYNLTTVQQTKINNGRARVFGYEGHLAYSYHVWTFGASYSHLEGKNQDHDEPLRLTPDHQLTLTAAQQLGPIIAELKETIWSGFYDRDATNNWVERSPWQTLDFDVRTVGLSDWEISAGVLDIFDQPRELTIGYPEPQRRFFLSALRYF